MKLNGNKYFKQTTGSLLKEIRSLKHLLVEQQSSVSFAPSDIADLIFSDPGFEKLFSDTHFDAFEEKMVNVLQANNAKTGTKTMPTN